MRATAALITVIGVLTCGAARAQNEHWPIFPEFSSEWAKRPSAEEIARVYPTAAAQAGMPGMAFLICRTRDSGTLDLCRVSGERPEGKGFAAAALALTPLFQLSSDHGPIPPFVLLQITFEPSQAPADIPGQSGPELAWGDLTFVRRHRQELMSDQQVQQCTQKASASVRCVIASDGAFKSCGFVGKISPEFDVVETMLAWLASFRVSPKTRSGRATAGGVLNFPYCFAQRTPDHPPASATENKP